MSIEQQIAEIKAHMPEVYRSIQDKSDVMGNEAFSLVRRGLRGEANCFWAMEKGYVMGTPFALPGVMTEVAQYMVQFGCAHVCIWAESKKERVDGTN